MTVERVNAHEIKRAAMRAGMKTLRHSGWQRVKSGGTTLEEVLRLTADTEDLGPGTDRSNAPVPV